MLILIFRLKKKSIKITSKNIESKTFIAGADAAKMTDQEIFTFMAKLEGDIERLEQIKHKPQKLLAAIALMKADVVALGEYVDSRA